MMIFQKKITEQWQIQILELLFFLFSYFLFPGKGSEKYEVWNTELIMNYPAAWLVWR